MRSRFYGSLIYTFPPQRETAETTAPVIVNELFRMGLSSTDVPPFYGFLRGGNDRISRTESRDLNDSFLSLQSSVFSIHSPVRTFRFSLRGGNVRISRTESRDLNDSFFSLQYSVFIPRSGLFVFLFAEGTSGFPARKAAIIIANCEFIPHSTFHIPHYITCSTLPG